MAPVPRSALLARAFRARACTARQSFARLPKRSYASGADHGHTSGSDLPWMLGAGAVTGAGIWVLWPEPPKYGKGGHGHGEHADSHEEKEEEEESTGDDKQEESSSESKDADDSNQKTEDESSNEDKTKDKGESEKPTKENPIVNEDRDDNNREVKYADAKGGVKKRLESQNAIKQGNKGDQPGKSANVSSGQGEHVFNTDTKHSIDAQGEPGISNKAEGDAETAKLKTPVDPSRPQK